MLDSKPDDWWLVTTIATDKVRAIKGWVPAASLIVKSNDGTHKLILVAKLFCNFSTEAPSQDQEQVMEVFKNIWFVY